VEKSLESMEEEAEKLYRDERPSLLEDEAAATRDMMYALLYPISTGAPSGFPPYSCPCLFLLVRYRYSDCFYTSGLVSSSLVMLKLKQFHRFSVASYCFNSTNDM
jgi:hypothetical protein